jgi:hypothetical protein
LEAEVPGFVLERGNVLLGLICPLRHRDCKFAMWALNLVNSQCRRSICSYRLVLLLAVRKEGLVLTNMCLHFLSFQEFQQFPILLLVLHLCIAALHAIRNHASAYSVTYHYVVLHCSKMSTVLGWLSM